jgi:hypothetical protein
MFGASKTKQVSSAANYIEDVFSTYLYTGAGTAQTITNNIDLSTKGGLVWIKNRGTGTTDHQLVDTARGAYMKLASNITNGQASTSPDGISAFNTDGFSIGGNYSLYNTSGSTYASWTFRKQPKFFDVVTYTGDGTSTRNISHSLGSTPGFIVVKRTDNISNWTVYHRSAGSNGSLPNYLQLNGTAAATAGDALVWPSAPTSTYFTVGSTSSLNANAGTYVAYIFAHDAGGFGLTGTDNVISCGSFTADGTGKFSVTLGYEPQWLLVKRTDTSQDWYLIDNMRGFANLQQSFLSPNLSSAENNLSGSPYLFPTATGFQCSQGVFGNSAQCIYIAIRRGPMKVPTDATKVFAPIATTGTGATAVVTGANSPPDVFINSRRADGSVYDDVYDRLRGPAANLRLTTYAEDSSRTDEVLSFNMNGTTFGASSAGWTNYPSYTYINYFLQRAPSFCDVVCFTGTSNSYLDRLNHNLTVAPELIITKKRSATNDWYVYSSSLNGGVNPQNYYLYMDGTNAVQTGTNTWGTITPNSTTFAFYADNGATYVSYLFATCAGVSKVGTYTGTGTLTTINCGFTGGARFVMIKRTDSTSNWFYWDTTRGMTVGSDPSLSFNTVNAESNANSVYTITTGFQLLASPSADVNTNGGTYIYLAIA